MSRELKSKHLGRHDRRLPLGHRAKYDKYSQHKLAMAVLHHHYQVPPDQADQELFSTG